METTVSDRTDQPLTREDLARLLKTSGIKPNTFEWRDYERAKRAIAGIPSARLDYNLAIRWIADYVGV